MIIMVATDLYQMYRGTPRCLFLKRELQQMADSIQISSATLASEMGDRSQTLAQLGGAEPHGTGRFLYLHTFDIFFVIWGKCRERVQAGTNSIEKWTACNLHTNLQT
jgi:hypothetical protein